MNVFNIIYLDMKYKIILNVNLKRTVYRSMDCELKQKSNGLNNFQNISLCLHVQCKFILKSLWSFIYRRFYSNSSMSLSTIYLTVILIWSIELLWEVD